MSASEMSVVQGGGGQENAEGKTILLITGMLGAENCAAMLMRQVGLAVEVAGSRRAALAALRRKEFAIVIVDEAMVQADPQGCDMIWQHGGLATPVVIQFATAGSARVVREVRSALNRRANEQTLAKSAVASEMQCELRSTVAGLLLHSQLALAEPEISPQVEKKLRSVVALASDLSDRLRLTA
jgi:signal transduction histidine kinase